MVNLSIPLIDSGKQNLSLINPILVASGTFSNGLEMSKHKDIEKLGGIISKGTTIKPREGNNTPRLIETPSGLINSIGFQNIGAKKFIKEIVPIWQKWKVATIVNIMGYTIEEYGILAELFDDINAIDALEINISCPNVEAGGIEFGQDPQLAKEVMKIIRKKTEKPCIVKLSPIVSNIQEIVSVLQDNGADAVTISNTYPAMAIDINKRQPVLGAKFGGLSGPAVKSMTIRNIYLSYKIAKIPIIASGGIMNTEDVIEAMMAGAAAVQIGTATYIDPNAPWQIIKKLEHYCKDNNINDISSIVGTAVS
ncbi:MAG: dihydroorotate dehydrogenase B catalytic subunit [Chloroflexi bacterium]|nr:dihydroorotate dehydrogenase B catalytic subunit [Chloroflexota bacterium]|tara:strand:+ start:4507 stop:5433 length:927 start_codon:yes stop_codon:yes gene_type:complete